LILLITENLPEKKKNKPKTNEELGKLTNLPVSLKLQILDFVSDGKTLITEKKELLPSVKLLPCLNESKLNFFTLSNLHSIEEPGYLIFDNFTGNLNQVQKMRQEAEKLFVEGKLKPSGMGLGESLWNDGKIRGDHILWVNERWKIIESAPTLYELLGKLDLLRQELNDACGLKSDKTQTQLACYPGKGSRYVRHLDAYVGGSTRRLTFLYYFNTNWKKGDGGELRLFLDGETKDVEPLADRLFIFQSRTLEHEVLPSHTPRFAITMWFY